MSFKKYQSRSKNPQTTTYISIIVIVQQNIIKPNLSYIKIKNKFTRCGKFNNIKYVLKKLKKSFEIIINIFSINRNKLGNISKSQTTY